MGNREENVGFASSVQECPKRMQEDLNKGKVVLIMLTVSGCFSLVGQFKQTRGEWGCQNCIVAIVFTEKASEGKMQNSFCSKWF